MHRTRTFLAGLTLTLALAACAPADTTIPLQGYDRSCGTASDCVVVQSGDICGCDCGNDAINRADLDKYNAEFADKEGGCSEPVLACPCVPVIPVCNQGKCALE